MLKIKVKNIKVIIDKDNKIELRNINRLTKNQKEDTKKSLPKRYNYVGRLFVNGKKGSMVDYVYRNTKEVKQALKDNYKKYKNRWWE